MLGESFSYLRARRDHAPSISRLRLRRGRMPVALCHRPRHLRRAGVDRDRPRGPRRPARGAGGRVVRRDPQGGTPLRGERSSRGGGLSLATGKEFGRLFETFEHTAFRLEVRDRYNEPSEADPLRTFLAGEPDDLAWFEDWLALVRAATAEGRRFSRVRVVSLPLTDYSRFGLADARPT